jgi:hypothetical protein
VLNRLAMPQSRRRVWPDTLIAEVARLAQQEGITAGAKPTERFRTGLQHLYCEWISTCRHPSTAS